jgi:CCR4-NOT transcription complex subunit 3
MVNYVGACCVASSVHSRPAFPCHPSFPTAVPPVLENPLLLDRLPADCMFLSFYFQQGSYQQFLAAKCLKKHSWRFHKKYKTWFQRYDDPKFTCADWEEGAYKFFDYEAGWCTKLKQDFKFEYSFLEDEVLVMQSAPPGTNS